MSRFASAGAIGRLLPRRGGFGVLAREVKQAITEQASHGAIHDWLCAQAFAVWAGMLSAVRCVIDHVETITQAVRCVKHNRTCATEALWATLACCQMPKKKRAKRPSAADFAKAAAMLGQRGGESTSPAKAAAARKNGRLGGRPLKAKSPS